MKFIATAFAVVMFLATAGVAQAGSIGFHALDGDAASLAKQFTVSVSASGKDVAITISNAKDGIDGVIADVYFDDDASALGKLLSSPAGWTTPGSSKNLPGGTAESFVADLGIEGVKDTFDLGESGTFVFSLASGATAKDVQKAIEDESLRVGIYVESLDSLKGGARSFISGEPVPEPLTVALVGLGLAGMAVRRRRLAGQPASE